MKFGTIFTSYAPRETVRLAILAEELGYDSVWITDHLMDIGRPRIDPWATIGAISVCTKRIFMASAVTDTQRCHPAKVAQIVATLSHICGGRVGLGIGAGEAMNVLPFGLPFDDPSARAQRLAEAIQVIKMLWSSDREQRADFRGTYFNLDGAWLDLLPEKAPPIYVGSLGGKLTLELTGKLGDGYLPWVNNPGTFRKRFGAVRASARTSGRDPDAIEGVANVYVTFAENEAEMRLALNLLKRNLLLERNTLRMAGFKVLDDDLERSYQYLDPREDIHGRIPFPKDTVPDSVALEFLVRGSPGEMAETIDQFRDAGATHVVVAPLEDGEEPLRKFSEKVMPLLRAT